MKFKLRDIVLDHHPACVAIDYALSETLTEMVSDIKPGELQEKELNVQLLIDGKEYDIKNFFQSLSDNYFKYLANKAKSVLFEDAEDTISRLHSTLYEIESKLESIKNDLSYDMKFIVVEFSCFGKPSYTTLTEHPSPPQFAPHVGDLLIHNGVQYCVIQRTWTGIHPIPHLKIYVRKT